MLYPMQCPVCGELLPYNVQHFISGLRRRRSGYIYGMTHEEMVKTYESFLCPECRSALEAIGKDSCVKCGKGLNRRNVESKLCTDCGSKIRLFEKCICVFNYNECARAMAAAFKYNHRKDKTEMLSFALAAKLVCELRAEELDAVIPVPVHSDRLRKRGYNQAGVIAEYVGHALGLPVLPDALIRNENTNAQNRLTRTQRAKNLHRAFSVGRVQGLESVLVIDDIYTTGATMEACTEVLLDAGIKNVYGACVFAGQDR